ncbi:MAG: class I SAM-dependent methyltransferase, partial [Oscillospiraceae bacterium]|nr:class I SAM-dependent methyltransferase [Oscillospiraceae bacterium]
MSNYKEQIIKRYGEGSAEDGRENYSRTSALEFHYTKKHLEGFITPDSRVLEIGCATGYYGMYYADKCREYVGVDLFPPHIEIFKQKIIDNTLTNVSCQVGDALNLQTIPDSSFDVVLCFGPMYHLPPEERELAFAECKRVCKTGGVTAFAYITTVGLYAGACVQDNWRHIYPNAETNEFVLEKGTDNERPYLFYFTMPEEMETSAARYGFMKLKNLATNFMFTMQIVNEMTDERFEL